MGLTFVYGRANRGKSRFCYEDIKSHYHKYKDKKHILIVPEQYSLQSEKNLLSALGTEGTINAEVLSFKRLAYRIFDQVGGRTGIRLNKSNKLIIISMLIQKNKDKLPYFQKAINKNGFINKISELITEFKTYGIGFNELDSILDLELRENTYKKIAGFNIIYKEYEKYIRKKYIDPDDDFDVLGRKIELSEMLRDSYIWIDEFSGFTPSEYFVISELLKHTIDAKISITTDILYDEKSSYFEDVFSTGKKAVARITKLAYEGNVVMNKPVFLDYKDRKKEVFSFIEENYFKYPSGYYRKKTTDLNIKEMKNMYEEINSIAAEILRMKENDGIKLKDITILTRNPEMYFETIEGVFKLYGIPVFIDVKKNLEGHVLWLFIKSLLLIFINNFSYSDVFCFLKTGLMDLPEDDIDTLENYVLKYGIKGNMWHSDKRWEMGSFEENEHIKNIRDSFLKPVYYFREEYKKIKNAKEFSKLLYEYLIDNNIPKKLDDLFGVFEETAEHMKIWDLIMEAIDSIVKTIGEEKVSVDEYLTHLEIAVSETKLGILPDKGDYVFAGSIDRSIYHDIKYLFLAGVNDGVFPAIPEESGILNDFDRKSIRENGLEIALDTNDRIYEEEYLVYLALTAASEKLYISYPVSDMEGKSLRPSNIINRIKKIVPQVELTRGRFSSGTQGRFLFSRGEVENENRPCVPEENRPSVNSVYGNELNTSITKLESFARCPFRYFVEHSLKAREREVLKLEMPDLGSVLHDSLEKLSKSIWLDNSDWSDISDDELIERVEKIYNETSDEKIGWILENIYAYKEINRRVLNLLKSSVIQIARQINRGEFKPFLYEIAFGDGMKIDPLTIKLEDGRAVKINGRIDRVDRYKKDDGDYIRIIDYKSGNKDFDISDVYNGIELQLVSYLDVIESDKSISNNKPGGVFYFKLDDPVIRDSEDMSQKKFEKEIEKKFKLSGLVLSDTEIIKAMDKDMDGDSSIIPVKELKDGSFGVNSKTADMNEFELLRKHVRSKIKENAKRILDGDISINPMQKKDISECDYCKYGFICRVDKKKTHNRLKTYKKDEVFRALKEKEKGAE
jgi:ATP-dependent helicase/nuclease subunit B